MPKETPVKLATFKDMDADEFKAGLFTEFAFEDQFCPISMYLNYNQQTLRDCFEDGRNMEEAKRANSVWVAQVAIAGIGQYSLIRGEPAGVLGRFDIKFRDAHKQEMLNDVDDWGEQVFRGIDKETENNPKFKMWDKEWAYVGSPRVVNFVFQTRSFKGDTPLDISHLVKDIEENAETSDMLVPQVFHLYHAKDGLVRYSTFNKPEDYNAGELSLCGTLENFPKDRLWFYPHGNKRKGIDYTAVLEK